MLNPCKMILCTQCRNSTCLLSLYVYTAFSIVSHSEGNKQWMLSGVYASEIAMHNAICEDGKTPIENSSLSVHTILCHLTSWVQFGQIFEFVKLVLFLENVFGGGQAPIIQILRSSLIPRAQQCQPWKWCEHSSSGFNKHKNLTNSDICHHFKFYVG